MYSGFRFPTPAPRDARPHAPKRWGPPPLWRPLCRGESETAAETRSARRRRKSTGSRAPDAPLETPDLSERSGVGGHPRVMELRGARGGWVRVCT